MPAPGRDAPGRGGSIFLRELVKTCLKWRTWIGFAAVAVLVPLVQFGLLWQGKAAMRGMVRSLEQDFVLLGNLFNGYLVTYWIMNSLWVHIPFLISLVAGDQLAGEATGGTFRLILIRPATRSRILGAKLLTTLLYAFTLVAFLLGLSLGLGLLLFGAGDLLVPGFSLTVLPEAGLPWRFALSLALAAWSMWCVASLALLFSSLVENAIGPIIGTMTVIIAFFVVSSMPIEMFEAVRPYLFTTYLSAWQKVFAEPVPWPEIGESVLKLGGHSVGFLLCTWYIFARKDILS